LVAADLMAQLEDIRRRGYAFSAGGLDPLIADVAVPVLGAGGHCRAALSVTAFVHDLDEHAAAGVADAAVGAARELRDRLAGHDPRSVERVG
jgi:DNA-binding IclR family transcriptional regulator